MAAIILGLMPLIIQIGGYLIGMFIKDQAAKDAALSAYYTAIQKHAGDGLQSVVNRQGYQNQLNDLNKS